MGISLRSEEELIRSPQRAAQPAQPPLQSLTPSPRSQQLQGWDTTWPAQLQAQWMKSCGHPHPLSLQQALGPRQTEQDPGHSLSAHADTIPRYKCAAHCLSQSTEAQRQVKSRAQGTQDSHRLTKTHNSRASLVTNTDR